VVDAPKKTAPKPLKLAKPPGEDPVLERERQRQAFEQHRQDELAKVDSRIGQAEPDAKPKDVH
jgi:hypothetical protein